jgi:hypothetical protein
VVPVLAEGQKSLRQSGEVSGRQTTHPSLGVKWEFCVWLLRMGAPIVALD